MLSLADYAVLAAKVELKNLYNSKYDEKIAIDKLTELYNRLLPHAEAGHLGAQLFLALEYRSETNEVNKYWLMRLAANNNPAASLKIATHHFLGVEGFERDYSLAAKYLAIVLQSQDEKVLYQFKELFQEISVNPKVNKYFKDVDTTDAERLKALSDELQSKHQMNLDSYLEKEYPYKVDRTEFSKNELDYLSAAEKGNLAEVKKYLEDGGNPLVDDSGSSALHKAAFQGHLEIVKIIIQFYKKYGLPVDSIEFERQDTPLSLACAANHPEVVTLLLEAGANPFRKTDRKGIDAFSRASMRSCDEALEALNDYANRSLVVFSAKVDNKTNYIYIETARHGARKECFTGEITCMSYPLERSSAESDPIFNAVNNYLTNKDIKVLVKKYDDRGGITTGLSEMQAFYALEYLKTIQASGEIKVSKGKNKEPAAAIESMQKYCRWSQNPSLAALCVRTMQQAGIIAELDKLEEKLDLPKSYSNDSATNSAAPAAAPTLGTSPSNKSNK